MCLLSVWSTRDIESSSSRALPEGSMSRRRIKPSSRMKVDTIIEAIGGDEGKAMMLLCGAVYENKDADTISACASQCHDISAPGPDGFPPLHIATAHGHVEAMLVLLHLGVRVDATDGNATALHSAATAGQLGAARLLVKAGANLDAQDGSGMTALHFAIIYAPEHGLDFTMAEVLVSAGANVHIMDKHSRTPAMLAVDNTRLMMRMIRHGSKPPLDVARLYVTLCRGSKKGDELLRILVASGWAPPPPQLNADNRRGDSTSDHPVSSEEKNSGPAHGDCNDDDEDDNCCECGHDEYSLLHEAVREDDDGELLQAVLAQEEEDPNTLNSSGYSPLTLAALEGSVTKVKALLGAGASLNLENPRDGCTALHVSAAQGHVDVTEVILAAALCNDSESTTSGASAGNTAPCSGEKECSASSSSSRAAAANTREASLPPAVVDMQDDVGRRPLHVAACYNNVQVMELLLGAGADVDSRDKHGRTPLLYAAEEDNAEAVIALLKAGASPDLKDSSGCAALHVAVLRPAGAVVEALIAAGASPGIGGERGFTPLHAACESNARGTVEALLRAGAVPGHCWNDFLQSPLIVACKYGSLNAVKLLLPQLSPRQINMRNRAFGNDEAGETPLVAAILCDCFDESETIGIVEALLEAGADPTLKTGYMDPLAAVIVGESTKASPTLGPPLIRVLVAAGADVNGVGGPRGFAPLHLACYEGACGEVVQTLLDAGADAGMPCAGSMQCGGMPFMTPLQLAGVGGNVEAVSVLIGHPACGGLNAVGASPSRATVLACAVQHGKTEVCRFLLEEGADMDLLPSPSEGRRGDRKAPITTSLIETAAKLGHLDAMNLLMQAKIFKDRAEEEHEREEVIAAEDGGDG